MEGLLAAPLYAADIAPWRPAAPGSGAFIFTETAATLSDLSLGSQLTLSYDQDRLFITDQNGRFVTDVFDQL